MTKYILHGGNTSENNVYNSDYFKQFVKGFKSEVRILLCFFSKEKSVWKDREEALRNRIKKENPGINLSFELADSDRFKSQLKKADVLYLHGGDNDLILNRLKKFGNLKPLLKGKVVAGSSAGAYVLSTYFYSNDAEKVERGLGILPIKIHCHHDSERDRNKVKQLKTYGKGLPIITLENYRSVIICQ